MFLYSIQPSAPRCWEAILGPVWNVMCTALLATQRTAAATVAAVPNLQLYCSVLSSCSQESSLAQQSAAGPAGGDTLQQYRAGSAAAPLPGMLPRPLGDLVLHATAAAWQAAVRATSADPWCCVCICTSRAMLLAGQLSSGQLTV